MFVTLHIIGHLSKNVCKNIKIMQLNFLKKVQENSISPISRATLSGIKKSHLILTNARNFSQIYRFKAR